MFGGSLGRLNCTNDITFVVVGLRSLHAFGQVLLNTKEFVVFLLVGEESKDRERREAIIAAR